MTDFRLCSTCQSHSQAGLCHCTLRTISDQFELTFARLRYSLGGDRPSQTTNHIMSQIIFILLWLATESWKSGISLSLIQSTGVLCFLSSHLFYTFMFHLHYKDVVKVHRVFPSSRWYSASARRIQFHWVCTGDSGEVVTPFVRVGTYPTRNFATFGPLWLRPPFTRASIWSVNFSS